MANSGLFSLDNEVAVVIGGGGVLGGAMAEGLASLGDDGLRPRIGVLLREAEQWWIERDFAPARDELLERIRRRINTAGP